MYPNFLTSCGDGLIRLPFEQVGQPEVHDQGLQREHGVGAPLRRARSRSLRPQPELPASALHDAASDLDALVAERVVPHPVEPAPEIPAAGLHVPVPVPGRRGLPDHLRRPARPDVRLASANRRARSAPGGRIAFTASEARSRQCRRPGTNVTLRPPKGPSQALGIQSAPSETTTGPPASCGPRRLATAHTCM